MLNFQLTEEQLQVQKIAKDFTERELLPGVLDRDLQAAGGGLVAEHRQLFEKAAKAGILGLPYPKEYGGQGIGNVANLLATVETSKVDVAFQVSYSVANTLFSEGVYLFGTEEQKKKLLPTIFSGEKMACFGLTEPEAGSDASNMLTTADKDGDYYVLNGLKCFISAAPLADYCTIYAKTQKDVGLKGISAFIVDTKTPGFRIGKIEDKMGIRATQVSEVILENCRVPANMLLGKEGEGFKIAMKTLDSGRIGVAGQGLGIAKGAFERAVAYQKMRKQFGKPISQNQHIQFRMAELAVMIEQAELMVLKAAAEMDAGRPYALPASKAKMVCTDCGMYVSRECLQLMGGNGFMREYHVERLMRDAKITQIYEGTNEVQRMIISGDIYR